MLRQVRLLLACAWSAGNAGAPFMIPAVIAVNLRFSQMCLRCDSRALFCTPNLYEPTLLSVVPVSSAVPKENRCLELDLFLKITC